MLGTLLMLLARFAARRGQAHLQRQQHLIRNIRATSKPAANAPEPPAVLVDERDPTTLDAIYVEPRTNNAALYHMVWSDEVHPINLFDHPYRELREERFGRTHDVETFTLDGSMIQLPGIYAGPQPYISSAHLTARYDWPLVLYSRTWNHMLHVTRYPTATYRETHPEILQGTREDAEQHQVTLARDP